MNPAPRVIAFDFDGVISQTNGFVHHFHSDEPNPKVVEAIKKLRAKGNLILIHTTRGDDFVRGYCEAHGIPFDYINRRPDVEGENPGKPIASVYVDDRALTYRDQDTDALVDEIERFKPYWQE
ncbi:MAG TPA: hypothetical protein VFP46_02820 [Candidatus Paceibacterota bacterium]|nr:hypothetical protein [Candidatus Paceibacterota bacterium]